MGTVFKYIIYTILVIAAFFIVKDMWDGEFVEQPEVISITEQVDSNPNVTTKDTNNK